MNQKLSKAPKIFGFIGISLSIIAFILEFPLIHLMELSEKSLYDSLYPFFSSFTYSIQTFLISIILPMSLLLISRKNSRKKAIVFIVITAAVILTQVCCNVINGGLVYLQYNDDILYTELDLDSFFTLRYFLSYIRGYTSVLHGSSILYYIGVFIKGMEYIREQSQVSSTDIFAVLYCVAVMISNVLYFAQSAVCLFGFITLLKKNQKLTKI